MRKASPAASMTMPTMMTRIHDSFYRCSVGDFRLMTIDGKSAKQPFAASVVPNAAAAAALAAPSM